MNPLEDLLRPQTTQAREQRVFGLVTATVKSIEADGTYRLEYLTMGSGEPSAPARVVMPTAGKNRGVHMFPDVGDEVVVGFEVGDTGQPLILGAVYNSESPAPAQAKPSAENNVRTIVSRTGHEITLDDSPGAGKVTIRTASGHEITLDDAPGVGKITVATAAGQALVLDDTPPGSVSLKTKLGAGVEASNAGGTVTIIAPGGLTLQAGVINLKGAAINLLTTGVPTGSMVTIDGVPFGMHKHAPPVLPSGTTGPVAPG